MTGWGGDVTMRSVESSRLEARGLPRRSAWCLLAIGLTSLALPAGASAARHDREQTRLYLTAIYRYDHAIVAHIGASKTAVRALASRIEGRCAHVVKQPARRLRHLRQTTDLMEEIEGALERRLTRSRRSAAPRLIAQVAPMRWRSAAVTRAVKGAIASLEHELDRPIPHVCEDLRSWVARGYRTLPHGTRTFMRERNAEWRRTMRTARSLSMLSRYATRFDRRLQDRIRKIQRSFIQVWGWLMGLGDRVAVKVGLLL